MRHFRSAALSLVLTCSFSLIAFQAVAANNTDNSDSWKLLKFNSKNSVSKSVFSNNLGVLNQQSRWKIGTVNAQDGTVYCAMVNKFGEDTILAFSRNAEGDDSIAVDFSNALFTPGVKYLVSLGADTERQKNFSAQANSERSMVVNLGRDTNFYSDFKDDRVLVLSSSAVEASFKLNKLYASYAILLDCAAKLNQGPQVAAAPITNVEKSSLDSKKYQSLEKYVESEFKRREALSSRKIEELDQQQKELLVKLKEQKQKVSEMEQLSEEQKKSLIEALQKQQDDVVNRDEFSKNKEKIISALEEQKQKVADIERASVLKQKDLKQELALQKEKVRDLEEKYQEQRDVKNDLNRSNAQHQILVTELEDQKQQVMEIKRAAELKQKELSEALEAQKEKVRVLEAKYDGQRRSQEDLRLAQRQFEKLSLELDNQKQKVRQLEAKYGDKGQLKEDLKAAQQAQLELMKKLVDHRQRVIDGGSPEYGDFKKQQAEFAAALEEQKQKVKSLEAAYSQQGRSQEDLKIAQIQQKNLIDALEVQKQKVKDLEIYYGKQRAVDSASFDKEKSNLLEELRYQKQKTMDMEKSLEQQQNNILDALALNLEVESVSLPGIYGDSFDSGLSSILKKHQQQSAEKVAQLKSQQQKIMDQLTEQKKKVFELQLKYENQKYAKEALEADIKLRDDELERLRTVQKENLAIIEGLTRQKQHVVHQEQNAENEQKDLIAKLTELKREVAELENKYSQQMAARDELKKELEEKERQIAQLKFETSLKADAADNRVAQTESALQSRVLKLQKDNNRLQTDLALTRQNLRYAKMDAETAGSGGGAVSGTVEEHMKKSAELARSFAEAKDLYEEKFAALQTERKKLKEKVELLELENKSVSHEKDNVEVNASVRIKKIKELEERMLSMAKQRDEMQAQIDAQEMQNKLMEVALKAKEQEVLAANIASEERSKHLDGINQEKAQRLAAIREEMLKLQLDKEDVITKLKADLNLQAAQYDDLKRQFDKRVSQLPESEKLLVEFEMKENSLNRLKLQLAQVELQREKALERASKARAELEDKKSGKSREEQKALDIRAAQLTEAQAEYVAKLSSAQAERDQLKAKLDQLIVVNLPDTVDAGENDSAFKFAKERLSELELLLASAGQQRQELADLLEEQIKEGNKKEKILENKENQLLSIISIKDNADLERRQLSEVQVELAELRAVNAHAVAETRKSLNDKIASYNDLEQEFDRYSKIFPTANKLAVDLSSKDKEVGRLQKDLDKIAIRLQEENSKVDKAEVDSEMKQVEFVEMANQQIRESERLAESLASTHEKYKNDILALQVEMGDLKGKLAEAVASKVPLMSEKEKLKAELELSKEIVSGLEIQVADAAKGKENLAEKLEDQNKKIADLQKQIDTNNEAMPLNFKNAAELAVKKEEIKRLEGQVYELKTQIADIEAASMPVKFDKGRVETELGATKQMLSRLEEELLALGQEKMGLSLQLEEQNYQISILQDNLASRENELMYIQEDMNALRYEADESNKRFIDTRAELESLKSEYSMVVNDLMYQLRDKIAQYDGLKRQYDEHIMFMPSRADMDESMRYIEQLQRQLDDLNSQRLAAEEDAVRAKTDLERSRMQLSSLKNGLRSGDEQFAKMQESLAEQQAALDRILREQQLAGMRQAPANIVPVPAVKGGADIKWNDQKQETPQNIYEPSKYQPVIAPKLKERPAAIPPRPKERPEIAQKSLSRAESFLNKIMSHHRPGDVPEAVPSPRKPEITYKQSRPPLSDLMLDVPSSSALNLEGVLTNSGMSISGFVPIEQTESSIISQWRADDAISGMYEQIPVSGDFRNQVDGYIDRYREDCQSGLSVRMSPSQKSGIGTIITADLECNMPSNSYANSVVFLQGKDGFSSILHTSYPENKTSVKRLRDRITKTLRSLKSFSTPYSIESQKTVKQYKFNIPKSAETSPKVDLETVIIQ